MYMALVKDPDFNIIQQSHGLFAIAKLLVEIIHVCAPGCPAAFRSLRGASSYPEANDRLLCGHPLPALMENRKCSAECIPSS